MKYIKNTKYKEVLLAYEVWHTSAFFDVAYCTALFLTIVTDFQFCGNI